MSYWNNRYQTTKSFALCVDNTNQGWMEVEGTVDAICDVERSDGITPGSIDIEIDYDTVSVWGDVGWTDEEGEDHCLTVNFYGSDADAFLSAWGVDVAYEVEDWENTDDF